jgi:hypothetical protein
MRVFFVFFMGLTLGSLFSNGSRAQQSIEPWVEPQDTVQALLDSDRYAWRLFVALNWPADLAKRQADTGKRFGDDGVVVWETWHNSRNSAPDTVFRQDGSDPGPWLDAPVVAVARQTDMLEQIPTKLASALASMTSPRDIGPVPAFDPAVRNGNEIRMNRATYEFIRDKKLYNQAGIIALVRAGASALSFPTNAKEVKAEWRVIQPSDKPRYHWAEFTKPNGEKELWGLTALHISTKDLPRWFWSTFEHIDNKEAAPVGSPEPANGGWQNQSVDRLACPQPPHNCNAAPRGIGLEGTKWENYRLRGTQTDWVDNTGLPTVLGNSQIEGIFENRSSCMNCHAKATKDIIFQHLNFGAFEIGVPNRDDFLDPITRKPKYLQLDFVWTFIRARPAR